jgi:hypothetical protein
MGKFIRIFLLAFFMLIVSAGPLLAMGGWHKNRGGGNHGGGGGSVPEIDPSLAPSAIAFVTGGLLILRSKAGRKKNSDSSRKE